MKIIYNKISSKSTQTKSAGIFLAKTILFTNKYKRKKNILFIQGLMGIGKTIFVKGFAQELKILTINSPSFNLFKIYNFNNNKLFHMDLFRFENNSKLIFLLEEVLEYLSSGDILLIESVFLNNEIEKLCDFKIEIKFLKDDDRLITIEEKNVEH
ncbi:MAG: tRNA (adenosine(37)-N6)-threonylcarbamoyltransferase complex ATPase subunit type 1 TsaE [Pigeon pea little leaf phytoplasma]|uniref:tRNA (Adenosine(37)-N6)-threonylcarbamoyltransferase complex ATPase subunit type 1 TsaE n=2 Tax=Candidatus Phytoplasma fabacearum TaxID=2982628 RepID=A0ABU8ZSL4_9MOLU|nr:tRNA (adenosine(37)-N6)-threonylcarbamoyltransferase complex ATPase subunit type 1 TsaE ['Bituminaria bituminosa' little leaf phytoplasma]MDV3154177.1 tRNA (adenosine(37)-N6)-threonylcarbamoyltransferase complex ATPase subunit type 1 TsaE [Pigeon pea little leaf phytoplasma]MDO7983699.1 tRNA (adenosine(37)-N6)-threonylcarbamoyltransferase complex ATPase subunit type 1 TsaE ['Bituminaria bituminosa' little leaf phytoplasma]MDO8030726.1 tRNA (adenosine(37)-N6)-threonylcarbamoyltransferase compl